MVALVLLSAGCVRHARPHHVRAGVTGTCEGACGHYLSCKGDGSAEAKRTCVAECREIFVYEGEPDRRSLEDFENLQCEAAVAFVDGDGTSDGAPRNDGTRRTQAP